jgi:hypothetical protein
MRREKTPDTGGIGVVVPALDHRALHVARYMRPCANASRVRCFGVSYSWNPQV